MALAGSSLSNASSNISMSFNPVAASQDDLAAELKSRPVSLVVVESLFLLIINCVAFVGNALVCLAFYRNSRLRIIPNYYIISLALTDLLTSVFSLPFSVGSLIAGRWPFGDWTCRLQGYCVFAFSIASLHTMALTACNRYIRAVHFHLYPNLYTSKLTVTTVLLIWAWALICSALPFILGISTFVFHPGTVICYSSPSFTPASIVLFTTTLTINIPAPMAVVIILYHKVFKVIRQQRFRVSTERRLSTNAEEIRLAQLLFTVSLGFCLCWGPVMAVECIRFIGVWAVSRQVYLISTYFGATSSAINVFIYGVMNRAFRVEFVKILCCKKSWLSNIEWCNFTLGRHSVLTGSALGNIDSRSSGSGSSPRWCQILCRILAQEALYPQSNSLLRYRIGAKPGTTLDSVSPKILFEKCNLRFKFIMHATNTFSPVPFCHSDQHNHIFRYLKVCVVIYVLFIR